MQQFEKILLSYNSYKEISQLKFSRPVIYRFHMTGNTDMHLLVTDTFFFKGKGVDQKNSIWCDQYMPHVDQHMSFA
jgi:hypothetical protein